MALTRRYLKELGLEDDAIDKIMAEHGKSIEGMITKTESEDAVKKAVDTAKAGWDADHKPIIVKESDEYKELDKKYQELMLGNQLTGAKVKDKYRDFVKGKLPSDKSFEDGIKAVKDEYPEFFDADDPPKNDPPKNKPSVGGGETPKTDPQLTEEEKIKKAFADAFKR
jgi:hypothetical protein